MWLCVTAATRFQLVLILLLLTFKGVIASQRALYANLGFGMIWSCHGVDAVQRTGDYDDLHRITQR